MRYIPILLLLVLVLPFASAAQTSQVDVVVLDVEKEESITVSVSVYNKENSDLKNVWTQFFVGEERYMYTFPNVNRGEKETKVFTIAIPEDLKGMQDLRVTVLGDDVFYERVFSLEVCEAPEVTYLLIKQKGIIVTLYEFVLGIEV
jgi:hypothetical protein